MSLLKQIFLFNKNSPCCFFTLLLVYSITVSPIFAAGTNDKYDTLMRSGSTKEIKSALNKNSDMITYRIGKEKNTLLMCAILYNREQDVIDLLLKAGIKTTSKNKFGQNAISYACQYCSDTDIFTRIVSSGGATSAQIRKRLLKKDRTGRYAASYAELNTTLVVRVAVKSYLKRDDLIFLNDHTKGGIPRLLIDTTGETRAVLTIAPENDATQTETTHGSETTQDAIQQEALHVASDTSVAQQTAEDARPDEMHVESAHTFAVPAESVHVAESTNVPAKTQSADDTSVRNHAESEQAEDAASVHASDTTASAEDADTELPMSETVIPLPPPANTKQSSARTSLAHGKTYLYDYAVSENFSEKSGNKVQANTFFENANESNKNGVTPLMTAIKNGNDWAVEALLSSGAQVNARDKENWTPLMYAVRYQNSEQLVKILIGHKAEIRTENSYGISPLSLAARYSENPRILSLLLSAYSPGENEVLKALVHAITGIVSSERIQQEKVQLFLDMGVPLNRFWEGKTPLMHAASSSSSTAIIHMLIKNGATVSPRTADGFTAFDFAQQNKLLKHDDVYWSLNTY
ncbi:MAG: ankyrin repeat domain-containing protein [Treponema sp.]|nr:ankyrin repeat domain-containing protein [Treponema sp.]